MKIERLFNHNVILSRNEKGHEVVYMGKGLAFQKKVGDEVDPRKVEKEFVLKDSYDSSQIEFLLSNIPNNEIELVSQLIELAEQELNITFINTMYITLVDHVHYAIERNKENINLPNPLLFEIKKFYPKEYTAAKNSIKLIKKETGIDFNEDEAGFITLHFVNGQQQHANMDVTMQSTAVVKDIMNIISRFFGIILTEDDINFQRIVTHLQFFLKRYLEDSCTEEEDLFYSI